jgi:DNA-binding CsgD family transcriptional regulator
MDHETTVLCPVMIGRTQPIAIVNRCLDRLRESKGHTLLIAGEAGIGKSRFVAEVRTRAATQGMQTLQGNCFEPDSAFPYAPLIDLLRTMLDGQTSAEIAGRLGAAAPQLAKILPEITFWLPDIVLAPVTDPEQEKRRLFHALAQVIVQRADAQPMVLVIEDMHWCDDISREFLLFFARHITTQPTLLLLTLRSDEISPGLGHFIAELERMRFATEINLDRLTAAEVDAMLSAMFASRQPVQAEFLHTLFGLSDGNPFFIEEIVNALIAAGEIYYVRGAWERKPVQEMHLPRTVRDAVLRRSEQLSAEAREVLAVAAVAGRRFDFTLLEVMTGYDELYLVRLMKEMVAAQLVVEESAEQFAFRHALTQQAIYLSLLARERKTLHRNIARAMEQMPATLREAHIAELAHHFYEAGEWAEALSYARQVGTKAQTLYAPRAAVDQFTRALDAARHLKVSQPTDLLLARGQAHEMSGEFDTARADYEAALAQARADGDQAMEWQALVCLGMLWAVRDYTQTGEYYRQAYTLAELMGDQTLLARSLNRIGNWHVNNEEPQEAQRHHHRALAIFQEQGDTAGIAETCDFLGMAYVLGADLIQGTAYYRQAIALFRDIDHRQGLSSSLATLGICTIAFQSAALVPAMPLWESQRFCEDALQVARDIGQRSGEAYAYFVLGCVLGAQGKWEGALDAAKAGLAIAEEIEHRQWICAALTALICIHHDLLLLPEGRKHGERALKLASEIGSAHWTHCAAGFLVSLCVQQGDLTRAGEILTATLAPDSPPHTLGEHLLWCAWIEYLLEQGLADEALHRMEALLGYTPHFAVEHHVPLLALLHGRALGAVGRHGESEAILRVGIRRAQDLGAHALLWRLQAELSRFYQRQHRRDEAQTAYQVAQATIRQLADAISNDLVRETFTREAGAMLPSLRAVTANRSAKQRYGGLTGRERDVARLIASGMSNKAIAEALIVSERTIETHVSNILSKLSFTTRAQIAVWAVENGLAHTTSGQ